MEKDARTLKRIATICEATGWNEETAQAAMANAASLGVTNGEYVANRAWEFNDEELLGLKEFWSCETKNAKKVSSGMPK